MESIGVERIGTPVKNEAGGIHAWFGKETVRRDFENLLHLIPTANEQGEFAVFTRCMTRGEPLANFPLHGDDQSLWSAWHSGKIH